MRRCVTRMRCGWCGQTDEIAVRPSLAKQQVEYDEADECEEGQAGACGYQQLDPVGVMARVIGGLDPLVSRVLVFPDLFPSFILPLRYAVSRVYQ